MASTVLEISHFVKRAADEPVPDFALELFQNLEDHSKDFPWPSEASVSLFLLTLLVFVIGIGVIRYTLWGVVGTLAAVEQPQRAVLINGYRDDVNKPDDPIGARAEEGVIVNETPKTTSIRTTLRHLHRQSGWKSYFRGISIYIIYAIVAGFLNNLIMSFLSKCFNVRLNLQEWESAPHSVGIMGLFNLICVALTSLALARWSVTWNNIVVSESSPRSWYQRVPPWSTIKQVAIPTLATQAADAIIHLVPALVVLHMLVAKPTKGMLIGAEITGLVLYLLLAVFVKLPCYVATARVYASLLPDEFDTVVPFDRTFGGRVVSKDAGGSGVLSWRDALRSFDGEARRRLVKLYSKLILIEAAIAFVFIITLSVEFLTLFSAQIKWLQHENKI